MLSALYAIVRPSVCLSITRVDHPKTVKVRMMKFLPCSLSLSLLQAVDPSGEGSATRVLLLHSVFFQIFTMQ